MTNEWEPEPWLEEEESFVKRFATREGTALYKKAINLLETKIRNEFGMNVLMGAELEYVIKCNDKLPKEMRDNPFHLPGSIDAKAADDFTPSGRRDFQSSKDMFFPKSNYITYSYKEGEHTPPYYHCESVISHEADYGAKDCAEDGTLSRMSRLADVIASTRNSLLHGDGGMRWRKNKEHHEDARWRDFRKDYVDRVFVDAYNSETGLTNGLHLNFSLVEAGSNAQVDEEIYKDIRYDLAEVAKQGLAFVTSTSDQITRHHRRGTAQVWLGHEIQFHQPPEEVEPFENYPHYIEHKLFAADSDPHLSVMLTLLGIYRGLEARKKEELLSKNVDQGDFSNLLGGAIMRKEKHFENPDNIVRTTLNKIDAEHNLGDRIFDYAREHGVEPPVKYHHDHGYLDLRSDLER